MQLVNVVQSLCGDLRMPMVAMEDDGSAAIALDGIPITFALIADSDAFLLSSRLGPVDPEAPGALARLMAANHPAQACRSGTLAVDGEADVFLMERIECADFDYPDFLEVLGRFTDRAESWRASLAEAVKAQGAAA
ncbi:MAG TPA: type III secretion system chaperone [Ramlibacter sp.]|nr:type III secretion system chaperone [Ramlibacter sp.]